MFDTNSKKKDEFKNLLYRIYELFEIRSYPYKPNISKEGDIIVEEYCRGFNYS